MIESYFKEKHSAIVELAPHLICKDMQHLDAFYQDVSDNGGEGVILRDPSSRDTEGRSSGFLKHKVGHFLSSLPQTLTFFFSKKYRDAEGRIVKAVDAHTWECEL